MGRWQKGESGNPAGRPKGIKDRRTLISEGLVSRGPELVALAVKRAEEGDSTVLTKLLSLLIPSPKPVDRPAKLDGFSGTLTQRGERILAGLAEGELTPSEGAAFLSALKRQAELRESDELERRISELECAAAK